MHKCRATRSCLYRRRARLSRGVRTRKVTAANVARLARRREPENRAFSERLKGRDVDHEEVDRIVHGLYRRAREEFDCAACANCCKSISPRLDEGDIARLAEGLRTTPDRVIADYLRKNDEHG
ncbi:MAG TPA: hypothetical protein VLT35_03340, partial [Methanocella sp.]|nr:hypothetical protein [Methanocella sp.]